MNRIAHASPGVAMAMAIAALVAACAGAREPPAAPLTATSATSATSATAASPAAPRCDRAIASACVGAPPSFAADIHPLVERRCFACHANGGEAADDHDFSRFETLVAQRRSVAAMVGACAMPPASAPPLAPDEAALLLRWIACGAPAP